MVAMRLVSLNRFAHLGVFCLFVLLPVIPDIFVGVVGFVGLGLVVLRKAKLPWPRAVLLYTICGVLAQVFQWALPAQPAVRWLNSPPSAGGLNLIATIDMAALQAWNPTDGANTWASPTADGFWRVAEHHPTSGQVNQELYLAKLYPLRAGQTYTQSVYLRAGDHSRIEWSFFTAQGHHRVRPTVVWSSQDVVRLQATYRAKSDDRWLRPLDLTGFVGSPELGFAQLEFGQVATPFVEGRDGAVPMLPKPLFWLGSALLAIGVLVAVRHWVAQGLAVDVPLVVGLALQFLAALVWRTDDPTARAVGFVGVPNLLGHGAALTGLLVVTQPKPRFAWFGLICAASSIWLSGSQAALVSVPLMLLGLFWRARRWAVVLAVVGLGVVLFGGFAQQLGFDPSALARFEIWPIAWRVFLEHPFGVGPYGFAEWYVQHRPGDAFDPIVYHPHNLILGLLVEFGVLGLIGWLCLVVAFGRDVCCDRGGRFSALCLVPIGALLINVFDYTWFTAGVGGAVYASLGCWLAARGDNRSVKGGVNANRCCS